MILLFFLIILLFYFCLTILSNVYICRFEVEDAFDYHYCDLEKITKKELNIRLIYLYGSVISKQSLLYQFDTCKKPVRVLPINYKNEYKAYNIPKETKYLLIPFFENGFNSVLILINPLSADSNNTAPCTSCVMVVAYSGICYRTYL